MTRTSLSRITPFVLVALAFTACEDAPRTQPRAPANRERIAPAAIGHGDGEVPQVHLPLRLIPPTLAPNPISLGAVSALTPTADGGALLLWATAASSVRTASQLALRAVAPDGSLGPIWEVRRTPGIVRGIDLAMNGEDALMVWDSEVGGSASLINGERVRPDGTLVGGPFGIGMYRVRELSADGGAPTDDRLGFPVRVAAAPNGFSIAIRGTVARCAGTPCPSVRIADIDRFDVINGRGGVEGLDPAAPLGFVGSATVPASLAVTFGGANGPARITTFGTGPLAHVGLRDGAVIAAWLHQDTARAIVRRNGPSEAFELVGETAADAGAAWLVQRTGTVCTAGVPAVRLDGPSGSVTVRVDEPGAPELFAWAMNRNAVRASNAPAANAAADLVSDVVGIRAGLLVARASRIEIARCAGDVLGPASGVPWVVDAAAETPAH